MGRQDKPIIHPSVKTVNVVLTVSIFKFELARQQSITIQFDPVNRLTWFFVPNFQQLFNDCVYFADCNGSSKVLRFFRKFVCNLLGTFAKN